MKKKMLSIIATIAAFALFVPSVMAATTPELIDDGKILLANGTPITIEALSEGEGALVKWDGGQLEVAATTAIFGGMHNDDTEVDTSITMNGGTVKHIFGGGLHKSNVGLSEVTLNGGIVTGSIMGGGYAGYISDADFSSYKPTDIKESIVRVSYTFVWIYGGTVGEDVFGGGGGYSYTENAYVYIAPEFTGHIRYVTGGGSNGYTQDALVEVYGGTIDVLQAVNYGFINDSDISINGGKITNAYASAEGASENLGVQGLASLRINGGEVTNAAVGQLPNATDNTKTTEINVEYVEGAVINIDDDINEEDLTLNVILTITTIDEDGEYLSEIYPIKKGTVLTKENEEDLLTELNYLLDDSGYVLEGLYTSDKMETKFEFPVTLDEDTLLYVNVVPEKPEELPPKTGDINLALLIGTLALGIVGTVILSKKKLVKSN